MTQAMDTAVQVSTVNRSALSVARRSCAVVAGLAMLLSLTACGGGDNASVELNVGVVVDGQARSGATGVSGGSQSVAMSAGQSVELDANEPVVWTLMVGGSAFTGSGSTVYYAGVNITQTTLSSSRIVVDTDAANYLSSPVPITLIATSTWDSAQVATVHVLITN